MKETKHFSWANGELSKGCKLCVQGRKMVLFVTGLCPNKCFYCPISEKKFDNDDVYANEWKISKIADLIKEAKLTSAYGCGITGGDPLVKVDRCVKFIKLLKKEFGKKFHIHLYTPLELVTKEKLAKLHSAGLDEIRFHPNLKDDKLWNRIRLARMFKWDVGVEIPVIPGYEYKKLIDYVYDKVDFLNLNELELSDTSVKHYKLSMQPKDDISYGVKGSVELGKTVIKYAESKSLKTHLCTAKLKDAVQMRNRLKLRAKNVAFSFDKITKNGLLLRGCAYGENTTDLFRIQNTLDCEIVVDKVKKRLLMSVANLKKYAGLLKKYGLKPAIVEEFPTADAIEMEIEFL